MQARGLSSREAGIVVADSASAAVRVVRPAVVCNPATVDDAVALRREIAGFCAEHARDKPAWFETTEDDPGGGQTREALAGGADLILVCGGDGTVAACAAMLTGTDTPIALLASGTGNLLARNLGVPLELSAALTVAFGGGRRVVDVVETEGGRRFVIMAGLGFDAAMIRDTNEQTKATLGWPAYVGGVARAMRGSPRAQFSISVDGSVPKQYRAVGVIAGNVGRLQAGLALLPGAVPDDGVLDLLILAPRTWRDWPVILGRLVTRRADAGGTSAVLRGARFEISVDRALPIEFDGELSGQARSLTLRVLPGALAVCVPA